MLTVKWIHLLCIFISISGFVARLYWRLQNSPMALKRWVRIVPHGIDTLLLLSGILLVYGSGFSLQMPWLQAKLVALVIYILLGMKAFRWARDTRQTLFFGIGAILVFVYMVATALTKNPVWIAGV